MPSTSDDMTEIMKFYFGADDGEPGSNMDYKVQEFLISRGYRLTDDGKWEWTPPKPYHQVTLKEHLCIQYMIEEWDFGGVAEPSPKIVELLLPYADAVALATCTSYIEAQIVYTAVNRVETIIIFHRASGLYQLKYRKIGGRHPEFDTVDDGKFVICPEVVAEPVVNYVMRKHPS